MTRLLLAASLSVLALSAHAEVRPNALKLNEIQVLGTHNSYAQPVDKRLLAEVDPILEKLMPLMSRGLSEADMARFREEHPHGLIFSEALNYDHPDLKAQLNAGLRSLELDVNADPVGGHYMDPAGYRLLRAKGVSDLAAHNTTGLERPGFKVLHVPDIDFRSHCPTLKLCLSQIREWSEANPKHIPLFLLIEAKTQGLPILPNPTAPVPFTPERFDELDRELVEGLGRDRLITPDDVRGDFPTLNAAIKAGNWPTLEQSRGKIILLMITATGPAATQAYLDGHPSLKGRAAFVRAEADQDHAAFLMYDNAIVRQAEIQAAVKAGYLVRTRSDIDTHEAKVNDPSRAKAAFESGAQVVSTDYFQLPNPYGTPYVVSLPGGSEYRCTPVICTVEKP
ncbi:MAG: Ca2+-dependent phosphoinositide-specific phospholipase C [Asticcacaulis sp.]